MQVYLSRDEKLCIEPGQPSKRLVDALGLVEPTAEVELLTSCLKPVRGKRALLPRRRARYVYKAMRLIEGGHVWL